MGLQRVGHNWAPFTGWFPMNNSGTLVTKNWTVTISSFHQLHSPWKQSEKHSYHQKTSSLPLFDDSWGIKYCIGRTAVPSLRCSERVAFDLFYNSRRTPFKFRAALEITLQTGHSIHSIPPKVVDGKEEFIWTENTGWSRRLFWPLWVPSLHNVWLKCLPMSHA